MEELDYTINNLNLWILLGCDLILGCMIKHLQARKSFSKNNRHLHENEKSCQNIENGNHFPIPEARQNCQWMQKLHNNNYYKYSLQNHRIHHSFKNSGCFYRTKYCKLLPRCLQKAPLNSRSIVSPVSIHHWWTVSFLCISSAIDTVWRQKLILIAHRHRIKGNVLIRIADF